MDGGSLVREARRRAGLSQSELAARAGTTQSAIARIESGRSSPAFRRVAALIAACGLELRVRIAPPADPHTGPAPPADDARSMLRALADAFSPAVVVGEVAAALRGGGTTRGPAPEPALTIVPEPGMRNLDALASALRELHARVVVDGGSLPFERDAETLAAESRWSLTTSLGRLDIDQRPSGTDGYRDLERDADSIEPAAGLSVASLADVVRIVAATDPVDDEGLALLRRALDSQARARRPVGTGGAR